MEIHFYLILRILQWYIDLLSLPNFLVWKIVVLYETGSWDSNIRQAIGLVVVNGNFFL